MWFENLAGEKPLRGQREVMGGWVGMEPGKDGSWREVVITKSAPAVPEWLIFLKSLIWPGQVW